MPPTPAARGPTPLLATLLTLLLCVIWGSTWLVIKEGLVDLPPFSSAALRFSAAALIMIGVAHALGKRESGRAPPRRLVLITGITQFMISYAVVYWAEQYLPSALTSVLWASYPLMLAVAAHFTLPEERLRLVHFAGFFIGFVGVVLLFLTDIPAIGKDAVRAGLVLLISPVAVAVGTIFLKRAGPDISSLKLNRNSMVVGAIGLSALAVLFENGEPLHFTPRAIFSLVYLTVVGSVVTFTTYFWLLRYAPAYKLAVIPYLTPVTAFSLGYFVAGEPIGAMTFGGMGLILVGVLLVTTAGRKRAAKSVA